jgi:glycosyl transferase family 7 (putative galactosyltransferase)
MKISLCTICMNRLSHLCQTLPVNLAENSRNPDVEFVLLNYNSRDDLDNWVRNGLSSYISAGKLKYYKTSEPEFFHMAHSKNLALKLAQGDILGVIDADNFAGPDYAGWVLKQFDKHGPQTVTTTLRKDRIPYRDQGGKICFTKEMFHTVNGFDERLIGYGMDDVDFVNRVEKAGGKRVFIEEERYLKFIGHSDLERVMNYRFSNYLSSIYQYIRESLPDEARFLYLFKDKAFSEMIYKFRESLKADLVMSFGGWTVERENSRKDGFYEYNGGTLFLRYEDGSSKVLTSGDWGQEEGLSSGQAGDLEWRKLRREDNLFFVAGIGFSETQNRLKYAENDRNEYPINAGGWGRGTVYCNFDTSRPVQIS